MVDESRMAEDDGRFPLLVLGPGGTFQLYYAYHSTNVRYLSEDIAKKQGVALDDQILTFRDSSRSLNNVLLTRTVTLNMLSIDKDTSLVLSRKSDDPSVLEIIVKRTWDLRSKCLYLNLTDAMDSIARRIQYLDGVCMDEHAEELGISYKGKQVYAGGHLVDGMAATEITLQSIGIAGDPFPQLIVKMVAGRGLGCHICAAAQNVEGDEKHREQMDID